MLGARGSGRMGSAATLAKFRHKRLDIVLTISSIIQGLAFAHLMAVTPGILGSALDGWSFVLVAHAAVCFLLILRVFQTYVTAALEYEEWNNSFVDILLIFVVGAGEYWVIASLKQTPFDASAFGLRLAAVGGMGLVGYAFALIRVRCAGEAAGLDSSRERNLQLVNIAGTGTVVVSGLINVYRPELPDWWTTRIALLQCAALWFGMYYSLRVTFGGPLIVPPHQANDDAGAEVSSKGAVSPDPARGVRGGAVGVALGCLLGLACVIAILAAAVGCVGRKGRG